MRCASSAQLLTLRVGDKEITVLFSEAKKIKSGEWPVVGHEALSSEAMALRLFHIAGELHEGDTFVRMLSMDEYADYPAMSVFGFELVQRLLSEQR